MNTPNKNSKISLAFRLPELLWASCVLFLTTLFFLGSNNFKSERQTANQYSTHSTSVHDSKPTRQACALSEFDLIEESEPTDESAKDDAIESAYPLLLSTIFSRTAPKNSFVNLSLFLQKRADIPLFLLHHSWKIPFA